MPFYYFGSKQGLLHYYPRPVYDTIIEPFAGSARYACKYGLDCNVWINDKYKVIYNIWKWIQQASPADIRNLPKLKRAGESIDKYKYLSDVERDLLGFSTGVARATPGNIVSPFGANKHGNALVIRNLMRLVGRIDHWIITNLDYSQIPNQEACWFIDPPYQEFGHHYKENSIDYQYLANWCLERQGQIIVCEGGKANWLPFKPLGRLQHRLRKTRGSTYEELVFYRSDKKSGLGIV